MAESDERVPPGDDGNLKKNISLGTVGAVARDETGGEEILVLPWCFVVSCSEKTTLFGVEPMMERFNN
ncbi:hypothetical protein RUM43_004782 [Polyplax serrata]|uniref:Uncharacterized protein n=1 Tax=Polyplax serrata TaxID=468196 RepID=A0AAN8SBB5_POLSC